MLALFLPEHDFNHPTGCSPMGRLWNWWIHLRLRNTLTLGVTILFGLVALSTVFVHAVEGWSWLDSLYFSIVSVTTVGYGDLVPQADATKLFLILYLPVGIGVGFVVLTTAVRQILESQRRGLTRVHVALPAHENRSDDWRQKDRLGEIRRGGIEDALPTWVSPLSPMP